MTPLQNGQWEATKDLTVWLPVRMTPLQNWKKGHPLEFQVWLPVRMTPLQNYRAWIKRERSVWLPVRMTPLQNELISKDGYAKFDYQSEWHRSKTWRCGVFRKNRLITSQNDTAPKPLERIPHCERTEIMTGFNLLTLNKVEVNSIFSFMRVRMAIGFVFK